MVSKLPAFFAAYPDIAVEMGASESPATLIEDGFDLAIHSGDLPDSNLIARKFAQTTIILVATPRTTADDQKAWWLERTNEAIAPFVRDRDFNWEFHIDETPFDFWSIRGHRPPPADSEDEKRWARENMPSPRTSA